MADLFNNGAAQMGQFPLEQWFYEMPPCTRYWTTATVIASVLVQCKVLTPFQLFYTFRAVYYKSQVRTPPHPNLCAHRPRANPTPSQYRRILTTFIYFGPPSLDLLFHVFFMTRYSRLLESSSASPATFSWLLLYATTTLLTLTSLPLQQ